MSRLALISLILLTACYSKPDAERSYIAAANAFTERYAHSRLGKWHVRASAAGADCAILLVQTGVVLDRSMVESLHHGTGAYDVYTGGVDQFSKDLRFRGVAYRDSRRTWPYGSATIADPDALVPCQ